MSKPVVAVVGRPNVGKSTLFSAITEDTISVIKDTPGVTRDRIYTDCERLNTNFTLISIDGIEPDSRDIILSQMREQAGIIISTADVIVLIVGVRQGLVDVDSEMVGLLRKSRKPVVLAVNKVDSVVKYGNDVYEFYNLGTGGPIVVPAVSWLGIGDLLDEVVRHLDSEQMEEEEDERPRIAVVDKPSAGELSITNEPLGEDRVIASDIAGTIGDAMDTEVTHKGTPYVFIDTVGLCRKSKIKKELERYSIIRTVSAARRTDVAVVVIDAIEGVTEQDIKIVGIAHERGKGITVAVNKWDAIEKTDKAIYEYTRKIKKILSFIPYAEFLFIPAAAGQRLVKLFKMIGVMRWNQSLRVATGVLDEIMTEAVVTQQSSSDKGERLRTYHMTRVAIKPPTFVIFVNDKELMHFFYTRYPENQIRNAFGFKDTPLKFLVRERKEKEQQV